MNKKTKLAILGVIGLVLVTLSLTYAYWLITRTQTKENVITAGCLDISLSNEQNDIKLTEQFPLSDDEGKELTPYTFTVTNNCNTSVDYYLNLEALGNKDIAISASSLKVMVNDFTPSILGENFEEEPTIADAYASYRLDFGTLAKNGSADYTLRLWIDEDAPISEMNKSFSSKISVTVGQGINNPLKEGTLAYDLVSQYGGKENVTKMSTEIRESEWKDSQAAHNFDYEKTRYYEWGTDYEFDVATRTFTASGKVVTASIYECVNGIVECGKYSTHSAVNVWGPKYGSEYIYEYEDFTYDYTGGNYYGYNAKKKIATTDFDNIPTDTTKEMHTAFDNYETSYFLRGNIENNYVKFGKWSDSDTSGNAGKDMYWRIVRINGDGTIRLVYDGVEKVENGVAHTTSIAATAYNSNGTDKKYIDYTYLDDEGNRQDSAIKNVVDDWYETNLKAKYGKYISDNIFCANKTEEGILYTDANGDFVDSASNAVATVTYFSTAKLTVGPQEIREDFYQYQFKQPDLTCKKEYSYNVSGTKGNGYLTNPVGLLNADEALMSGIYPNWNGASSLNYLNSGERLWTMSPYVSMKGAQNISINIALGYVADSNKMTLSYANVDASTLGTRPVINLKADVKFTGNGSYETPYVITTN